MNSATPKWDPVGVDHSQIVTLWAVRFQIPRCFKRGSAKSGRSPCNYPLQGHGGTETQPRGIFHFGGVLSQDPAQLSARRSWGHCQFGPPPPLSSTRSLLTVGSTNMVGKVYRCLSITGVKPGSRTASYTHAQTRSSPKGFY